MQGCDLEPGEKDDNIVLDFKPDPTHDMLVACLVCIVLVCAAGAFVKNQSTDGELPQLRLASVFAPVPDDGVRPIARFEDQTVIAPHPS